MPGVNRFDPRSLEIKTKTIERTLIPLVSQVHISIYSNIFIYHVKVFNGVFQITTLVNHREKYATKAKNDKAARALMKVSNTYICSPCEKHYRSKLHTYNFVGRFCGSVRRRTICRRWREYRRRKPGNPAGNVRRLSRGPIGRLGGFLVEKKWRKKWKKFFANICIGCAIATLSNVNCLMTNGGGEASTTTNGQVFDRSVLVRAARQLLSSVTRVLLLADRSVVKQILKAEDKVCIIFLTVAFVLSLYWQ